MDPDPQDHGRDEGELMSKDGWLQPVGPQPIVEVAKNLFAALDNLKRRGLIRGEGDHLEEVDEALQAYEALIEAFGG